MWLSELRQDTAYAIRGLSRSKRFALVAVGSLAVGIGVNASIFSVVSAVLLQPLPFHEPEELVAVWQSDLRRGNPKETVTPAAFRDWETQNEVFESMSAWFLYSRTASGDVEVPEYLSAGFVTRPFFDVLGVRPVVGRFFNAADGEPESGCVAVLSHNYWRTRFASDPGVPGQMITLDREQCEIVGVAPEQAVLPPEIAMWQPIPRAESFWANRGSHYMRVVARLGDGVTLEAARANMEAIADRAATDYPSQHEGYGVTVNPLQSDLVGDTRAALLMLQAAALVVLLIACVNVANLLLARSKLRAAEFGVRAALGAGRGRLVRQLLTESILLAGCGTALGVCIAAWVTSALVQLAPTGALPSGAALTHPTVVLAMAIAALVTGVAFGVLPAWRSASRSTSAVLRASARQVTPEGRRLREILVVGEVALSCLLLVGAGLFLRSFVQLVNVDPGVDTQGILSARVVLPRTAYSQPAERAAFFRELHESVERIPGVQSAGLISNLPVTGGRHEWRNSFARPEQLPPSRGQWPSAMLRWVSPRYFETVHLPVLRGRRLTYADTEDTPNVMLIDEALARQFFPGEDPIAQRLVIGYNDWEGEIVGVVGNVQQESLKQPHQPHIYVSFVQTYADMSRGLATTTLTLRSAVPPQQLTGSLREAVSRLDPHLALTEVETLEQRLAASVTPQRNGAALVGAFAAIALVLAAIGLYGVIADLVSQQYREFGIRIALGALERDILAVVLRHGFLLIGVGMVTGLAGVLAVNRLLTQFLFGVSLTDAWTILGVCVLTTVIAVMAMLSPARRAAKADPVEALRVE